MLFVEWFLFLGILTQMVAKNNYQIFDKIFGRYKKVYYFYIIVLLLKKYKTILYNLLFTNKT